MKEKEGKLVKGKRGKGKRDFLFLFPVSPFTHFPYEKGGREKKSLKGARNLARSARIRVLCYKPYCSAVGLAHVRR